MFAVVLLAQLAWSIADINPSRSTLDPIDPGGASGGRVHNLAGASDGRTFFAASEWGGLFRSGDGGQTWAHVPGHVPQAMWDVAVDPSDSRRVYATSLYDGRVVSRAGINVSADGGVTWNKPSSAVPPEGFCSTAARRDEPSAYGISIDSSKPSRVVAGTSCGVAISDDSGATWRTVDPTPGDAAGDVWDVLAHSAEIIDICGVDGHRRSVDGGQTWSGATSSPLPSGRCSMAVSPDEPDVLFAVVGTTLYESDDGGASWPHQFTNPAPQGRIPFVVTNQRPGAAFDLWFGDVGLWRAGCATPAGMGSGRRCPENAWSPPYDQPAGAHPDAGDLAFVGGGKDDCPALYSNDGGVYVNTRSLSPDCHAPAWEQPQITPHALWLFGMDGADQTPISIEDLYLATQDNGVFATRDASVASPAWDNVLRADSFDVVADPAQVVFTHCCYGPPRFNHLLLAAPGMTGIVHLPNYPPGEIPAWGYMDPIARYGPRSYAVAFATGVYATPDLNADPVVWTQLGTLVPRVIQVALKDGTPVFFGMTPVGNGRGREELWHYTGADAGGTWQRIQPPGDVKGFGIFAVDPNDADRILAAHVTSTTQPRMILTTDRGATWSVLSGLDALMTGHGEFRYLTLRGPVDFISQIGYPQPTMAAFDPDDRDVIVAGGADSGLFVSVDGGAGWTLLTDPHTPTAAGPPHIPRPRFAYFDHEATLADTRLFARVNIYVGSQGRGVWRVALDKPRFDALGICDRYPTLCASPTLSDQVLRFQCDGVAEEPLPADCVASLPFQEVCTVFECSHCVRPGLCRYSLSFQGLDPSIWYVGVIDQKGNPAADQELQQVTKGTKGVMSLSFRPRTSLQDYSLVLARKRGRRGMSYELPFSF